MTVAAVAALAYPVRELYRGTRAKSIETGEKGKQRMQARRWKLSFDSRQGAQGTLGLFAENCLCFFRFWLVIPPMACYCMGEDRGALCDQ